MLGVFSSNIQRVVQWSSGSVAVLGVVSYRMITVSEPQRLFVGILFVVVLFSFCLFVGFCMGVCLFCFVIF